ncbi:unnamed protein product [Leuciscus chuanchicus]
MPERRCAVGCDQIRDHTKGISLYRIPKETKRRNKWLAEINRQNADGGVWVPTVCDIRIWEDDELVEVATTSADTQGSGSVSLSPVKPHPLSTPSPNCPTGRADFTARPPRAEQPHQAHDLPRASPTVTATRWQEAPSSCPSLLNLSQLPSLSFLALNDLKDSGKDFSHPFKEFTLHCVL